LFSAAEKAFAISAKPTVESHPELRVGDRVRFRIGFDKLGVEQLAVQVKPTTITSPKARESK
jgi:hypothetical protein